MANFILTASNTSGSSSGSWMIWVIYGLLFVALYFFLIRPQNKKRKQQEEFLKNLEVGDQVTTIGGIMGKIISINEETESVVLETYSEKTRLRIKKWAIGTNNTAHEAAEEAKGTEKKPGLLDKLMGGKKPEAEEK